jgi:hypothetical protein
MSKSQLEYALQCEVAKYLREHYPGVLFHSDLSGIRLTIGQAKKAKAIQESRGYPDLFIAVARRGYHGLFCELKINSDEAYTKTWQLRKDQHIQEQQVILNRLIAEGYFAIFVCGFDEVKKAIDWYLGEGQ